MHLNSRRTGRAVLLALGLLLSACGGGEKNEETGLPIANVAPVANAGNTQSVFTGSTVTLDASASTDANADALTYQWSLTSKPTGSNASLSNTTSVKPTFVADVAGSYQASLVVNDGKVNSAAVTVTITAAVANVAPVANAGTAQSVTTGTLVTLDGSTSSDANAGDIITYTWTLTSKPGDSAATLSAANTAKPTFTADKAGSYVAQLIVNDGKLDSNTATVTITAAVTNVAPIANAGVAQSVTTGTLVTLDGSASSDANGDSLVYTWSLTTKPSGSAATLSDTAAIKPTFTADKAGSYVAQLIVYDGKITSTGATVTITAAIANVAPVANAGAAQNVATGTVVTLDGSNSSDANGDSLTYVWSLTSRPAGSAAVLSSANAIKPSFTADLTGTYVFSLKVNDGALDSPSMTVTITASATNVAPVANAGSAQSVSVGAVVTLDASASSDANGDSLSYVWSLTGKPAGSTAALSSTTAQKPTFTADLAGTYAFSLKVNDGQLDSASTSVAVTAAAATVAPVANAGSAQNVSTGTIVTLDGSASSDPGGNGLTYSWTLTSVPAGSNAVLSGATAQKPTFTADIAGNYTASLVVNDGVLSSTAATVTVTATVANTAPVANAGSAQSVSPGTIVTLDGSTSSDANGDSLTYSWSFTSLPVGSSAVLSSTTAQKPTFTADIAGTYIASLVVSDGQLNSAAATVTITAAAAAPSYTYSNSLFGSGGSTADGAATVTAAATGTGSTILLNTIKGKIASTGEGFSFASQDVTGNFTITATVSALSTNLTASSSNQFRLGVMFCDCANGSVASAPMYAQSTFAATATAGSYSPVYAHRLAAAINSAKGNIGSATSISPNSNLMFKLVRSGNAYTASYSTDGGTTWTVAATSTSFTGTLPSTVKAGVFAASGIGTLGTAGSGATVTFDNVTITPNP